MSEGIVAADELRLLIERIERMSEEKQAVADDIKDIYAEAKSRGYDTKTIRAIVRLRKMETHDRQEAEALLETYKAALGLGDAPSRIPRTTKMPTPLEEAIGNFETATEGVAVSMSVGGGDFVPVNKAAREAAGQS